MLWHCLWHLLRVRQCIELQRRKMNFAYWCRAIFLKCWIYVKRGWKKANHSNANVLHILVLYRFATSIACLSCLSWLLFIFFLSFFFCPFLLDVRDSLMGFLIRHIPFDITVCCFFFSFWTFNNTTSFYFFMRNCAKQKMLHIRVCVYNLFFSASFLTLLKDRLSITL